MIENVPDLQTLAATGAAEIQARLTSVPVGKDTLSAAYTALHVHKGQLLIWNSAALPIVDGKTCTAQFMDLQIQKFPSLFERPLASAGALKQAVFVNGSDNYYHFLAHYFAMFAVLADPSAGLRRTIAIRHEVPKSVIGTLRAFLGGLPQASAVDVGTLQPGIHTIEDVVFPTLAPPELAGVAIRRWLMPFVFEKHGHRDPLRERGPLKLFVRREGATTGRNLLNQGDVEAWFAARGYTSVNPGALPFEEQVILFSRATHIAGVEGAAFTNILFAINARQIIMIASPALRAERLMAKLVKRYHTLFHTLYGDMAPDQPAGRNGDYLFPIGALTRLESAVTGF